MSPHSDSLPFNPRVTDDVWPDVEFNDRRISSILDDVEGNPSVRDRKKVLKIPKLKRFQHAAFFNNRIGLSSGTFKRLMYCDNNPPSIHKRHRRSSSFKVPFPPTKPKRKPSKRQRAIFPDQILEEESENIDSSSGGGVIDRRSRRTLDERESPPHLGCNAIDFCPDDESIPDISMGDAESPSPKPTGRRASSCPPGQPSPRGKGQQKKTITRTFSRIPMRNLTDKMKNLELRSPSGDMEWDLL